MDLKTVPQVNLKTHKVYPEIIIQDDGAWEAKLLDLKGNAVERWEGKVNPPAKINLQERMAMRKQATSNAWDKIILVIEKYKYTPEQLAAMQKAREEIAKKENRQQASVVPITPKP